MSDVAGERFVVIVGSIFLWLGYISIRDMVRTKKEHKERIQKMTNEELIAYLRLQKGGITYTMNHGKAWEYNNFNRTLIKEAERRGIIK